MHRIIITSNIAQRLKQFVIVSDSSSQHTSISFFYSLLFVCKRLQKKTRTSELWRLISLVFPSYGKILALMRCFRNSVYCVLMTCELANKCKRLQ